MGDLSTVFRGVLADARDQARELERAATQDRPAYAAAPGTVTSVALTLPAIFSVTGSPVTTAGTLAATLASQSANLVWAGPTTGSAAAPTFRSLVAADLPAGTGTVTSVALSLPAIFTVSGSPVTGSGTLTGTLATQTANYIWAGPTSGGAATPTFRAMVSADIPSAIVTYAKIQNVTTARLLGRTTAGAGVVEEISVGAGLTLSGGVLDVAGGGSITGSGTDTYLTRWTGASSIGDSTLYLSGGKIISAINSGFKVVRTGADATSDNAADASLGYTATMYTMAVDRDGGGAVAHQAGFYSDSLTESTKVYGHLIWYADATYDIGASSANRARDAYLSRSLYAASIKLLGSSSGTATITPPAAAGTPTLTLPTSTGTLALTSDVTTAVSGTSGKLAKFTSANVVGNSIVTESGAAISVAGAATLVGQSNTNQFVLKGYSTQTSPQILIQSSAAAELARLYVNATYSIALGYQAGASLGASTGSVLIGYQAGNALTTNDIVAIGYKAGYSCTAARNVFIGKNAGRLTVGGDYNVAIGEGALETNVSGQSSLALGYGALGQATASENVAIGASALQKCTTGYYNVGIGTLALGELLGATGNLGIGQSALRNLVSGTDNTAIGTSAGYSSTGSNNVLLGHTAGGSCTGSNNVIIGYHAGRYTGSTSAFGECVYIGTLAGGGTGNYCVGVGRETLTANVTAATALGYQAGKVVTGAGSVMIGYQAGVTVSSGANNTILGYQAGASLTTNGGCVMIGYQAGNAETAANKLYIANSSTTTPLIYGDFSTPSLTFNGTVNIADGKNLVLGGTTGTKLGSANTEKLGVWGATPIVQPTTGVAAATFTANSGTAVNDASTFDGYTIGQIVKALRNMGALA